jgi:hypothetical protein
MSLDLRKAGRSLLRAVRVAVAVGLVWFLAAKAGLGGLAGGGFSWAWLSLGVVLMPLSVAVRAYNHRLLLNQHERIVRPLQAMRLALIGAGLGLILPQSAADLLKAHYGWRTYGHAEDMVVSSILDRLTSLTAVAALGAAGALASGQPTFAGWRRD